MSALRVRARLFPDYGEGSPIWVPWGRLPWADLEVSPDLRARLMRWADDYENGTTGMSEEEFVA